MFIGHFAVGLAARPLAPRASLPVLLAAPMALDIAWPILVTTGIEQVRIVPGITAASPLALDYMPYSHSLVMALAWAALFAIGYVVWTGDRRGAPVLGALVVSHWVLDWIAHRPDMQLAPGVETKVGLGLWDSVPGTLIVETAMFVGGALVYARATRARDRIGGAGFWILIAALTAMYFGAVLGPPPPSVGAMMGISFASMAILGVAWWIGRHRENR